MGGGGGTLSTSACKLNSAACALAMCSCCAARSSLRKIDRHANRVLHVVFFKDAASGCCVLSDVGGHILEV